MRLTPAHRACRDLVERLASGPDLVYLFWPTLLGYLRIVIHPGILPRPLTPAQAEHNIGELLARPHVRAPRGGRRLLAPVPADP